MPHPEGGVIVAVTLSGKRYSHGELAVSTWTESKVTWGCSFESENTVNRAQAATVPGVTFLIVSFERPGPCSFKISSFAFEASNEP